MRKNIRRTSCRSSTNPRKSSAAAVGRGAGGVRDVELRTSDARADLEGTGLRHEVSVVLGTLERLGELLDERLLDDLSMAKRPSVQEPARREGEGSTNGTGAEEDEVDLVEDGTLLV